MTKKNGGLAWKFVSPGTAGVPDRIVLLPDGKVGFVELKDRGKKPRLIQTWRMEQLVQLGFKTYVVDGEEQIEKVLREIGGEKP